MKRLLTLTAMFLLLSTAVFSSNPQFISGFYRENVIIACFSDNLIGHSEEAVESHIENGYIQIDDNDFNSISYEFGFTELNQIFDFVKKPDWNKGGVYLQNIYRITIKDNSKMNEALSALRKHNGVVFAEFESIPQERYIPNDPSYSNQWHLPKIQCPEAWDYETGSQEVIVGIVDSGVKWNHPDLQDHIWINEAELNSTSGGNPMTINWETGTTTGGNGIDDDGNGRVDDVIGWNFYYNNNQSYQPTPDNDHGTHVAGCAAAIGDNGIGVSGSAMNVKIMVTMHRGTNSGSSVYNGLEGVKYCAETGADIINCSWGGYDADLDYENSVITYATDLGALVVAAAGNGDDNGNGIQHGAPFTGYISGQYISVTNYQDNPSDCIDALSVSGTDQADLRVESFDYGEAIDIMSPGVSIYATVIENDGYGNKNGTSMASPIVAGVCALVKSKHPDLGPRDVKARVEQTSDYIYDLQPEEFQGLLGYGRVNAFAAVMYDLIPNLQIESIEFSEISGDGDGIPNPGDEIELSMTLANQYCAGGPWLGATGVTATLTSNSACVNVTSPNSNFPDIGEYNTGSNSDDPFVFTTEESLSDLTIPFTITITANQDAVNPYTAVYDFEINLSLAQSGWPMSTNGAAKSSALILDIDLDGTNELIFGDATGNVHAISNDGVTELPGFPVNVGNSIEGALAVDQIDSDAQLEIVAAAKNNHIVSINHDGSITFDYVTEPTSIQYRTNPAIADMNGDGSKEILANSFNGNLYILNNTGSDFVSPISLPSAAISPLAVGDLNGDNQKEVIIVTTNGELNAISYTTGENIAGFPVSIGANSWKGATITNIDDDLNPEILVANLNGVLYAFNHDGSELFQPIDFDNSTKTGIVTGDLNLDGDLEIAFLTSEQLILLDDNGNYFDNFPVEIGSNNESTPILVDIDNDGFIDILFGDGNGLLHAINIYGNECANFPIALGSSLKLSPTIGYFDTDTDIEIAIADQELYHVIDYKRDIGNIVWDCYRATPARTGNYFDLPVDNNDLIESLPNISILHSSYPNPFVVNANSRNSVSTIEFDLRRAGMVSVKIFNIKGQVVSNLTNDFFEKGRQTVTWNGKDENNRSVQTGIYFYKVSSGDFEQTKKMMLIK